MHYFQNNIPMKILTVTVLLCICVLLPFASMKTLTLHVQHPAHKAIRRHTLATGHQKLVIHHDMRVFGHQRNKHLTHAATSNENYHLNEMGYFFALNLTIAGLPYKLNIDTGSSDIFIKGESSPGNPAIKYTCPECLKKNEKVSIGYMDGFLDTYKANLEVKLGNHTFNESILVAYTAPKTFEDAEGLVGLSFKELARNSNPTFLQTLINNKIIGQYAFGVNLNFQQHDRSMISFGSPDADLFEGELKKYHINAGSYMIPSVSVQFQGDAHPNLMPYAILDTGNTCISIPDTYERQILKAFNVGSNICKFDNEQYTPQFSLLRCRVRDVNLLPVLKISIQGDFYPIDKDAYTQRYIKSDDGDLFDLSIESVKYQSSLFLGDSFFNRYYTFFDVGKREIGIAKNKEKLSYKNLYKDASDMDDEDISFYAALK